MYIPTNLLKCINIVVICATNEDTPLYLEQVKGRENGIFYRPVASHLNPAEIIRLNSH